MKIIRVFAFARQMGESSHKFISYKNNYKFCYNIDVKYLDPIVRYSNEPSFSNTHNRGLGEIL